MVLVIISVLAVCIPAYAGRGMIEGDKAYVSHKTGEARVRQKPNKNSTALATVVYNSKEQDIIEILASVIDSTDPQDIKDGRKWYFVRAKGKVGYIREDFISKIDQAPVYAKQYGPASEIYGLGDKHIQTSKYLPNIARDMIKWRNKIRSTTDPNFDSDNLIASLSGKKFTQKWDKATKRFQQKNGLTADGLIGKKTKTKLWKLTH